MTLWRLERHGDEQAHTFYQEETGGLRWLATAVRVNSRMKVRMFPEHTTFHVVEHVIDVDLVVIGIVPTFSFKNACDAFS